MGDGTVSNETLLRISSGRAYKAKLPFVISGGASYIHKFWIRTCNR